MDNGVDLTAATVSERVGLSSGADGWTTKPVPALGIRPVRLADGPHGLRVDDPDSDSLDLFSSLPATCFPPAVALASTWNTALIEQVGNALAAEARKFDVDVLLGPGINIKRSPLGGRNFEYFSEDPHLTGRLGAALVHGLQSAGVGACVKHFAVNNQETDRMRVDAIVGERALREIYLRAFEHIVITEKPWMIMGAYNFVNGVAASEHRQLLTEILREEWGFDGVVVSDWGAVYDRVASVAAGLDLEMPTRLLDSDARLLAALEAGEATAADVDRAASRVVALARRAESARRQPLASSNEDHHGVALAAAREAIVLLKNDGILPLSGQGRLAVIGEFARAPRYQGAGSSHVVPTRLDDALTELGSRHPQVTFAAGYSDDPATAVALRAEAVTAATGADAAVLFLGLPAAEEAEGFDREHLDLPPDQLALLRAVADVNPGVVVVLSRGGVVVTSEWDGLASALVDASLLGQAGGSAIAEMLLGEISPSGRLAETIPLRLEDTPSFLAFPGESGRVVYGEGVFVGYRGYDRLERNVSYPFGHGLSYSTFDHRLDSVEVRGAGKDLAVSVTATIANTGARDAAEVAQFYVAPGAVAGPRRPARELRAFRKVSIVAGESAQVTVELGFRDFARWDEQVHDWVVDDGEYAVELGASSRDIRASTLIALRGAGRLVPLGRYATLEEWLRYPGGPERLREWEGLAPLTEAGDAAHATTKRMLDGIPLPKLVRLFGIAISEQELDTARRELNTRSDS